MTMDPAISSSSNSNSNTDNPLMMKKCHRCNGTGVVARSDLSGDNDDDTENGAAAAPIGDSRAMRHDNDDHHHRQSQQHSHVPAMRGRRSSAPERGAYSHGWLYPYNDSYQQYSTPYPPSSSSRAFHLPQQQQQQETYPASAQHFYHLQQQDTNQHANALELDDEAMLDDGAQQSHQIKQEPSSSTSSLSAKKVKSPTPSQQEQQHDHHHHHQHHHLPSHLLSHPHLQHHHHQAHSVSSQSRSSTSLSSLSSGTTLPLFPTTAAPTTAGSTGTSSLRNTATTTIMPNRALSSTIAASNVSNESPSSSAVATVDTTARNSNSTSNTNSSGMVTTAAAPKSTTTAGTASSQNQNRNQARKASTSSSSSIGNRMKLPPIKHLLDDIDDWPQARAARASSTMSASSAIEGLNLGSSMTPEPQLPMQAQHQNHNHNQHSRAPSLTAATPMMRNTLDGQHQHTFAKPIVPNVAAPPPVASHAPFRQYPVDQDRTGSTSGSASASTSASASSLTYPSSRSDSISAGSVHNRTPSNKRIRRDSSGSPQIGADTPYGANTPNAAPPRLRRPSLLHTQHQPQLSDQGQKKIKNYYVAEPEIRSATDGFSPYDYDMMDEISAATAAPIYHSHSHAHHQHSPPRPASQRRASGQPSASYMAIDSDREGGGTRVFDDLDNDGIAITPSLETARGADLEAAIHLAAIAAGGTVGDRSVGSHDRIYVTTSSSTSTSQRPDSNNGTTFDRQYNNHHSLRPSNSYSDQSSYGTAPSLTTEASTHAESSSGAGDRAFVNNGLHASGAIGIGMGVDMGMDNDSPPDSVGLSTDEVIVEPSPPHSVDATNQIDQHDNHEGGGNSSSNGTGKYFCSVCHKRFTRPSALAVHSHMHTGAKPFACLVCNRSFSVNSNLRRHMKTHTRDERTAVNQ